MMYIKCTCDKKCFLLKLKLELNYKKSLRRCYKRPPTAAHYRELRRDCWWKKNMCEIWIVSLRITIATDKELLTKLKPWCGVWNRESGSNITYMVSHSNTKKGACWDSFCCILVLKLNSWSIEILHLQQNTVLGSFSFWGTNEILDAY